MSEIKIFLNGEERYFPKLSLAQLLKNLELDTTKVAIEKDLMVINSEKFHETFLNEGCRIEIVHFIGGG